MNGDGPPSAGADAFFVYLKLAQDTLLDPARRFAYDRFGPDVTEWRDCQTMQDFLYAALSRTLPQYIGGLVMIMLLNFFLWSPWGRYVSFSPGAYFSLYYSRLTNLTGYSGVSTPSELSLLLN
jgi:hypothetical protein